MNPTTAHSRAVRAMRDENKAMARICPEIPLKQWCHEEAERSGSTPWAVYQRVRRGLYPWLKLRRVNKRLVFVRISR